jgi:hypothetical protein
LTGNQIVDLKTQLLESPDRLRQVSFALILLGDVTECPITSAEIRQIAVVDQQLAAVNANVALAAVAPQDLLFGMARMWQAFTDTIGWQTAVFRTRDEAEHWIRVTLASRPEK